MSDPLLDHDSIRAAIRLLREKQREIRLVKAKIRRLQDKAVKYKEQLDELSLVKKR